MSSSDRRALVLAIRVAAFAAAVAIAATLVLAGTAAAPPEAPAEVLARYLRATYARDFTAAWREISPADRALKSEHAYLAENPALEGGALAFGRALAARIGITDVRTRIDGERATVSFRAAIPDANAAAIVGLAERFDAAALARLTAAERDRRLAALGELAAAGRLPMLESPHEEWRLVRAAGRWWLDLEWADAVRVNFEAMTIAGLGWQFEPVQREIRARAGETLQTSYRMTNPTAYPATAKARHVVTPGGDATPIEIVTCFCFLEQTLQPGQSIELPVVFRVRYDAPETLREIGVRYELYPAAAFPGPGAP